MNKIFYVVFFFLLLCAMGYEQQKRLRRKLLLSACSCWSHRGHASLKLTLLALTIEVFVSERNVPICVCSVVPRAAVLVGTAIL